ncbi:relaxase/mobilization nuclease domain-containing protein [Parabacteroides distasonis]|uniref:relaxase/mobilization nuclease domain-containing protein n=1 Tax=Parabacteroides distasonis TaxID=823 RepID=UPI001F482316|nr:relaxase/mobilization nuclease domain-containing protein [Parabacteroides distasonis]MCE9061102.1 relaxase/mobilization nuclease domain-containing protein [Parabacteroides distasonis]
MIAKIVKGSGFREVTGYIIDSKKDARIIAHAGLFIEDVDTITKAFEAQAGMNPKVSRPVGHIALGFSKEDESRLTSRIMAEIALEYMGRMGIRNTQFFIARHFDKEHPHIHIAYNRIDNDGRTISDKNERIRSTRICKELTKKYNLYFANGKERVKQHRLKEPDKTKYGLYSILKSEVSRCGNWNILAANLKKQGVEIQFKYKGKSDEVQGIVFTMNGYSFSGSKIDRRFSFSKIDAALERNRRTERMEMQPLSRHEELPTFQPESSGNDDSYNGSIGLFMLDNTDGQAEENRFEEELKRRNKKKKQRKIRF